MKTKRITKTLIITSVVLLIGGSIAFAHGGWGNGGYGSHMRGHGGHMMGPYDGHMGPGSGGSMMGYGPGWGRDDGYGNLSEEEADRLDKAQEKFYYETKELRRKIDEKRIDLQDELVKDDADSAKIAKMQKELSGLQADFDQKAVQHRLEMRKLMPKNFQERGYGRGYGRGGYCWE